MSSQKHIQDELRSFESGLPVNNNQPFSVPEGYFEGLGASILAKVKKSEDSVQAELDELSPILASIPKQTPYSVPSFYFENNMEGITAFIQESDSSVVAAIGTKMPYEVPEGYFETLSNEILAKVSKPKARVVPLFARTWMRVASAAAVAGVLFFGGYQLLNTNPQVDSSSATTQTTTTEQNLVANNVQPLEKQIQQASTKDLEDFIETVQVNTPKAPEIIKTTSAKEQVAALLKDVPTGEMESFLSALPTADDEFVITDEL